MMELRRSCKFVLPKEMYPFFLWIGKQKKRQKEFRAQFSQPRPGSGIARHKCAICGRTELTNPELQFRYCSKCVGNREYCQDHLFTHQHVK